MIFGLDHVTLAGAMTAARIDWLTGAGYRVSMSADNLDNLELKRPWLSHFAPTHSLRLFRAPGSAGVEIVDQSATVGRADRLLPILDRAPDVDDTPFAMTSAGPALWSLRLGAAYVRRPARAGGEASDGVRQFVWRTPDPVAARDFWRQLGFKVDSINPDCLRFRGIDAVECTLWLSVAPEAVAPVRLDAEGFTCFAVVTTSIADDVAALGATAVRVSEIGHITPGAHALRVAFAEAADGAVVELIGLR